MRKLLLDLGFKPINGIYYLADAIEMKKQNVLMKTGDIYRKIAKKYNINEHNVERCIRHCINSSDNKFNTMPNSEVITAISILSEER